MESRPSLSLCNVTLPSGRVADVTIDNGLVVHIGASESSLCEDRLRRSDRYACSDRHARAHAGRHAVGEGGLAVGKHECPRRGCDRCRRPAEHSPTYQFSWCPRKTCPRTHEKIHFCHFAVNSSVTRIHPFDAMWKAGAMAFGETFFAPSSYGDAVGGDALALALDRIHSVGGLATIHAEEIAAGPDTGLSAHDQHPVHRGRGESGQSGPGPQHCRMPPALLPHEFAAIHTGRPGVR